MTAHNPQVNAVQIAELEQLFKAKQWQNIVDLAQEKTDFSELNHTQIALFHWWLGQSYKELKQYKQAESTFNQAIKIVPTNHLGYEGLVNVAQHQKNQALIIERAITFQEKFPNLRHSYWWLGQIYKNEADYIKAEQQFLAMIEKLPNHHQGYEGIINIAEHKKDWQEVLKLAPNFIQKFPQMWQGYWWAGHAHKNLKQYEQAEQQFNLLTETFPNLHQGIQGLVESANHAQNWEKAIQYSLELQAKKPDMWQGYWWAGHAHKNLKQYEQAEEQFHLLAEKFPNDHRGCEGLVNVAQHQQNKELIIERATIFKEKFPQMWQGYWWAGHAHKNLKQYEQAEQQFNLLTETFPNLHQGIQGLVESANHAQNWEKAIQYSLELQAKKPDMWQGYWWAGHAHKNLKQYEQAEEQFHLLAEKFPNDHRGCEGLVNVAQHQQNKELIIERATIFKEKFPQMWQGYWWIGHTYKDLYEYEKAELVFNELIKQLPNDHRGYESFIYIAQHQQDWQKVIQLTPDFINKFPDMWQGYWYLGQAHKNLANYENAKQQFELIKERFPDTHFYYQGMIDIANHQNEWQNLLQFSEEYITAFPERIDGYFNKGMALKNLKRFDESEQFFIELAAQFPEYAHPYAGLADVYYILRKWDKGIAVLENAILLLPNDHWIINSLINNYLIYNEPDKALITFENYIGNKETISSQLLLARIYQLQNGNANYLDRLEKLYQQYPNDLQVAITYADALIAFTLEGAE